MSTISAENYLWWSGRWTSGGPYPRVAAQKLRRTFRGESAKEFLTWEQLFNSAGRCPKDYFPKGFLDGARYMHEIKIPEGKVISRWHNPDARDTRTSDIFYLLGCYAKLVREIKE